MRMSLHVGVQPLGGRARPHSPRVQCAELERSSYDVAASLMQGREQVQLVEHSPTIYEVAHSCGSSADPHVVTHRRSYGRRVCGGRLFHPLRRYCVGMNCEATLLHLGDDIRRDRAPFGQRTEPVEHLDFLHRELRLCRNPGRFHIKQPPHCSDGRSASQAC